MENYKVKDGDDILKFEDIDLSKTYTYADYLKWEFDERLELIKGKVFNMSPAPESVHQLVSGVVFGELYNFLKGKRCSVFTAPFDVRLPRKSKDDKEIQTVLQPDVCVICDPLKIDARGCLGAPDIVVEILSKGNNKKELKNKFEVYQESGVHEYWIIHPEEKTFLKYTLDADRKYQPSHLLTMGDSITSILLPDFVLSLDEVFEDKHLL